MSKEIWCTLGPASLNDRVIGRLDELGVSLFRLNLSHTKIEKLRDTLEYIHSRTSVPLCLDTEGAQVRTSDISGGKIVVRENSIVRVHYERVPGDPSAINLHPDYIPKQLITGDLLKIDAEVLAQVVAVKDEWLELQILNGGEIGQNKAVTVLEREITMPPLTDKDKEALAIGKEMGIRHVALSFANYATDVDEIRSLAAEGAMVVSKIECLNGLRNLPEIAAKSDALLIDRGDLSRQVSIEKIPALQKDIIHHAKVSGKRVYVATNLLESMIVSANPTRAEVNDVFNTMMDGADGLVLAAETAIGGYPVSAAIMVKKVIREYENNQRWRQIDVTSEPISVLVDPHGGTLVDRLSTEVEQRALGNLRRLRLNDNEMSDCVLLANGTYSPLRGFMTSDQLDSVLNENRLPDGIVWPFPILLQAREKTVAEISEGERIALTDSEGRIRAVMDVGELYTIDIDKVAQKCFGTASRQHPGVARLRERGDRCLAGSIRLVEGLVSAHQQFDLSPKHLRMIFSQKGWSRVVGFQSGSVPHRFHEYMQLEALQRVHADGIYISALLAARDSNGFLPDPIFKSYQLLLKAGIYPSGKVVLGGSSIYPRYGGPREALFNALCYQNMGCSHFIVERDASRVNGYYETNQTRRLFETVGDDIGIKPIFFETIEYNSVTQTYVETDSEKSSFMSETELQTALANKEGLPDWFMRDIVQEMLQQEIAENRPVFHI